MRVIDNDRLSQVGMHLSACDDNRIKVLLVH
jgi:hypothetical protein